jgi:hypothetical protein
VDRVRFGFVVPHADARDFAQAAALGERHGWDGAFTREASVPRGPDGLAEVRRRVQAGPPGASLR